MAKSIIPLPPNIGFGFTSPTPLNQSQVVGMRYETVGRFHNYHATPENWYWPEPWKPKELTIDGFSPNLNKSLHCGHLKNLAVARALSGLLCSKPGKPVAMLGAAAGVQPDALASYHAWCKLADYNPTVYFDNQLPEPKVTLTQGTGEYEGCKMYNDVVIYRSNGLPTYAAHDLAFAQIAHPDIYLTGVEQKAHFTSLGLGDKHVPLGLVLGEDGKKMRSSIKREGDEANALSAKELFELVLDCMEPSPEPEKLAWNILAWQFNSTQIATNTKFIPKQWAKPEAPGLYISYTLARIGKALEAAGAVDKPMAVEECDIKLLAQSQYLHYHINKAQNEFETHYVATYAHTLAKTLSSLYAARSISHGSASYKWSILCGYQSLESAMRLIGMHPLKTV